MAIRALYDSPMRSSLVDRRKTQTRQEIAQVALELFQSDGYGQVSVERIAEQSGVSLSTFYRYFAAKEDVLAPLLDSGTDALAAAMLQRPADEDLATAARRAYAVIGPSGDAYPRVRSLITLMLTVPALRVRWLAHLRTIEGRLAPAVRQRAGQELTELEAQLTAAAIVAGIRVSLELWAGGNSDEHWAGAFVLALDHLHAGAGL